MSIFHSFELLDASGFDRQTSSIPNERGVYLLLIRGGYDLLKAVGYTDDLEPPLDFGGWAHLYTGRSATLRDRIARHLTTTVNHSNVRETLVALHDDADALAATGAEVDPALPLEIGLSRWLARQCRVGFLRTPEAVDLERELLKSSASPLNISGRKRHGFVGHLEAMRRRTALKRLLHRTP